MAWSSAFRSVVALMICVACFGLEESAEDSTVVRINISLTGGGERSVPLREVRSGLFRGSIPNELGAKPGAVTGWSSQTPFHAVHGATDGKRVTIWAAAQTVTILESRRSQQVELGEPQASTAPVIKGSEEQCSYFGGRKGFEDEQDLTEEALDDEETLGASADAQVGDGKRRRRRRRRKGKTGRGKPGRCKHWNNPYNSVTAHAKSRSDCGGKDFAFADLGPEYYVEALDNWYKLPKPSWVQGYLKFKSTGEVFYKRGESHGSKERHYFFGCFDQCLSFCDPNHPMSLIREIYEWDKCKWGREEGFDRAAKHIGCSSW